MVSFKYELISATYMYQTLLTFNKITLM